MAAKAYMRPSNLSPDLPTLEKTLTAMLDVACWDMIMIGSVHVRANRLATAIDPHLYVCVFGAGESGAV